MIPTRTSRPFGRTSPRVSDTDLARLIDQTIKMRVDAKRDLGFAATNVGCDGRKRTTMFDGSACQVEGEVCIAERQDGISACINAPTQGNGLSMFSITFSAPVCTPVTGWYILDDDGYLYRIPTALTTPAAAYWPLTELTGLDVGYDLVRAGRYSLLMCASPVAPTLNDDGNSEWFVYSIEGSPVATIQRYDASIGGLMTHLETVPGFTDSSGQTVVAALDGRWVGVYVNKATTTTVTLNQNDVNVSALASGEEYKALIYASASGASIVVNTLKGVKAAAGTSVAPSLPSPLVQISLGISTVAYGGAVTTVSTGTTSPIELATLRPIGANSSGKWNAKGIIQRDADAPNAGSRVATITLPSADSGVVTGDVRVAFGYPMAYWASYLNADGNAPWGLVGSATADEKAARDDYDMALVYPPAIGVEYGPYHLNLAGADIATPDACEILSTQDTLATRPDTPANVLALPNGEVAVSRPFSPGGTPIVPQRFDRYRVRPAPSSPLTVALSQATLGAWPVDPNEWTEWKTYQVDPWLLGATSFDLTSGSWTHGKPVPCVVWQSTGLVTHWTLDVNAKQGQLQQPTAGTATVAFTAGGGAQAPDGGATPRITILGSDPVVAYGWTFSIGSDESALSPLTEATLLVPPASTYRITLTVPLGPTGTTKRTLYRFAYNRQDGVNASGNYETPWLAEGLLQGGVYDRMTAFLAEIGDNVTTTHVDTETTLVYTGVRPPSPLIGPAGPGITYDIPGSPFALPPLNL